MDSLSGPFIVSGTFGYSRAFNALHVEQPGYQWYMFDNNWNVSTNTGNHILYLDFDPADIYNATPIRGDSGEPTTNYDVYGNGDMTIVREPAGGYITKASGKYDRLLSETVFSSYSFTKPSGLGIQGNVSKVFSGSPRLSQVFIYNATAPESIILSDYTMSTETLTLNAPVSMIRVAMLSPSGTWYNSSTLFTPVIPTVTPTPTPTIPAGYVRNNLYIWDNNDAQISGADIDVLDVEAGTWTNYTADADGWVTIDTLPYHTVNAYAHYPTSNIYLPNEILGLETGYYGGHNWVLVLFPYTTTLPGGVTLYINARNYDTKAVLTGVGIQIEDLTTHEAYSYNTGTSDNIWSIVTNATNYKITGSKSGYISKSMVINSGEDPSKTVVIELSRATVTTVPTNTIPPGGVTTAITVAPGKNPDGSYQSGYTNMQGQEMMNWLAENGMALVQLCFLVTIFALLGIKFGK
jgi:hypothetical protein